MAMTYCSAPWAAVACILLFPPGLVQNVNEREVTLMGALGLNRHFIQAQIA